MRLAGHKCSKQDVSKPIYACFVEEVLTEIELKLSVEPLDTFLELVAIQCRY